MKAKIGYVITGIIALLMIIPAVSVLGQVAGGQIVEDQPVTRVVENEDEDYYESEWEVENVDGSLCYMWSVDKPTYDNAVSETDISDTNNIVSIEVNTQDQTVYPIAPWMANILNLIIPLVLIAGALYSFSQVVSSQVRTFRGLGKYIKQKLSYAKVNYFNTSALGTKGMVNFGELIGMVVSVFFAVIFTVKMIPIINSYAENITGIYGVGYLITLIPAILVISIFYKIFDDVF